MNGFRQHLQECMDGVPATAWNPDTIGDRDELNFDLGDITDSDTVHPEVTYELVRQHLETHGVDLPPATAHSADFLEEDGELILPLVAENDTLLYLYFAFCKMDEGYEVFAELLTIEELEEILDADTDTEPVQ